MHFASPLIHRAFWYTLIGYERESSYKLKCFISAVTETLQKAVVLYNVLLPTVFFSKILAAS